MARPTFSLSDNEARQLVSALVTLEERNPVNPRDHRPFVREFVRAVHRATGRTYSPAIYRRLLGAYAPERKPSTATLALEKERLVKELERAPALGEHIACVDGPGAPGTREATLLAEVREMLADLVIASPSRTGQRDDSYLRAQCDFLQQRLTHSEKALAEKTASVAGIDTRRQVLEAQLAQAREQISALQANSAATHDQLAGLTRAVDDARQFALLAIDEARGETRAWKERCMAAENQYKSQVTMTETFRRLAYRQGAEIPPMLDGRQP